MPLFGSKVDLKVMLYRHVLFFARCRGAVDFWDEFGVAFDDATLMIRRLSPKLPAWRRNDPVMVA
jgi:hypothetical protein